MVEAGVSAAVVVPNIGSSVYLIFISGQRSPSRASGRTDLAAPDPLERRENDRRAVLARAAQVSYRAISPSRFSLHRGHSDSMMLKTTVSR